MKNQENIARKYKTMVQDFLNGRLSAEEFARKYLDCFASEPGNRMGRPLFNILQDLFEDVDAYSPMWLPEDECSFRITETTLRREAEDALTRLEQYLAELSGPNMK
jgi:hypothetical protein